ncbi:MAG: rod shape-determining protein, partial [Firmicutes bacterium]|nr:rod shape-determining protein [Bacillota bacterium]
MALYYLNQNYQPGLVFKQLEKINYKMVVGIDVGHGECMAYVYRKKDDQWEPEPLHVNSDYETKIPSYIAYDDNGNPIIGKGVSSVSGFHVYFKQEPSEWNKKPDDDAPTYKQLMKDYISVVWNNIWTYNDIFHNVVNPVTKDDILVVIGCPASGSWTKPEAMQEYVDLTKAATGCTKVMILAESTAAIMTPIYLKKVVDLGNGVAIYDFGSSTLDFTYILMGKVLLTASIPLGGSDVDRAMLRYILRENGIDEETIDPQGKNKN